jgi:DNA polymerase-1
MPENRLILVDGTAVLYRAYFAIKNLETSNGEPTNAVFGFVRMVRQIKSKWKPSHMTVVFDGGVPQRRTDLHAEYKAQRPAMPEGLRQQKPVVEDYLDAARIAWARVENEEADDVIASMTEALAACFGETLIATGDKDIYQLVNGKVKVIPVAGKESLLDAEGIEAKTGVSPGLVPDWLALVGDASDNIPGLEGVGKKTASKILNEYGPLRVILDSSHQSVSEDSTLRKIRANRDLLEKNLKMVDLKRDLPLPLKLPEMEIGRPDNGGLIELFRRLEFESFVKELQQATLL